MEAERDMVRLKKCQYMAGRLGEVHAGHVASVHPFGVFVELDDIFVDGMVRIETLGDDYWLFDERHLCLTGETSGRSVRIGDPLRVQVAAVRIPEREIDFVPVEEEASAGARRRAIKARPIRRRH